MKSSITLPCIAAGIGLLASCYPIPDEPRQRQQQPVPAQSAEREDQQKIQEQRDRMREEAERRQQQARQEQDRTQPRETPPPTTEPTQRTDYAFATPVPGKEGFVFSPYNNKVVDVRDIPSGTLVQDPTYPPSEKKYFRVP